VTRIRWIATGVGVVVVALIVVFAVSPQATTVADRSPLINKPAPALAGRSLTGGGEVSLGRWRGRFVLVNFFAHWCVPCQQEEPQLEAFWRQHRRAGDVEVLGVVLDDQPRPATEWVEEHGGRYPVLADPEGDYAFRYGVRSPPTSFLVSPKGRILSEIDGPVTASGLDHLLALARARGY
jgi:cytochrome c biogenesis protein CcmG/thiol:disulfide interchange protein DsbE